MSTRKTRAFYIETLILVFLLLSMLTILVRVYGAAGEKALGARRKTAAALIAQNVSAMFLNEEGDAGKSQKKLLSMDLGENADEVSGENPVSDATFRFNQTGALDEDGDYVVTLQTAREARVVGSMLSGTINVYYRNTDSEVLASLDTARYVPNGESDIISDGSVIELDTEVVG